ncbi:MAG: PAS domain-containing sensor histidine kinase [Bacteroidetes bacterium]|nr:MAG: PAS domain-containing sensor histidine kinase [Bacteroidota bacterium]
MNKIILLSFISINSFLSSRADNTYPVSYSSYDYYEGGKLLLTKSDDKSKQVISFLIKPGWLGESDVIYSWKGIKKINAKGSIQGVRILDAYSLHSMILAVWIDKQDLFVALIDSATNVKSTSLVNFSYTDSEPLNSEWIGELSQGEYLFQINNSLYQCSIDKNQQLKINLISRDVVVTIPLNNNNYHRRQFVYLTGKDGWYIVNFHDTYGNNKESARIQVSEDINLIPLNDKIGILSSSQNSGISLFQIVDKYKGILSSSWLESPKDRISIQEQNNKPEISFLKNIGNDYYLYITDIQNLKNRRNWKEISLPSGYIEPYGFNNLENKKVILFRNGMITIDDNGNIHSSDFIPLGELFNAKPRVGKFNGYLVLSTSSASLILKENKHELWFINLFLANTGKIIIPSVLFILIIVFIQLYRHQKRFLNTILDLPSSGIVFIINKDGSLLRANDSGKTFLGITEKVPLKKIFQYYCILEHTKPLNELVNRALAMKDTIIQKINIIHENESKEWYCTVMPLTSITGRYRGLILTAIDITEELEKKRLSNWAQLAHDMQTNLSTIRLNAEQLEVVATDNNFDRRKKIIHQVGLLIQRVRDIVTVGRSDSIERQVVNAAAICIEARVEFDETLFPDVEFDLRILNFNVSCDKPKMIRALRNAIENGIRSLNGKPGRIKIACWSDAKYAFFSITDSGVGMDEVTKKKMLTPYFTTSKNFGGTGIGTMIMQHVVQLHGGELLINSNPGEGTEIIFCIPNYSSLRMTKKENES